MKLIIFDFDGTVFNTKKAMKSYLAKDLKKLGIVIKTEKDFQKLYIKNFYDTLRRYKVPKKDIIEHKRHTIQVRLKEAKKSKPFRGIPGALKQLKKRDIKVALISSGFTKPIKIALKKNKLLKYFDAVVGAEKEESKVKKIKKCMKKCRTKPKETAYVGDTMGDIIEAKKAKVKSIAVTWGYHSRSLLKKAKPDIILSKPKQLIKIINKFGPFEQSENGPGKFSPGFCRTK